MDSDVLNLSLLIQPMRVNYNSNHQESGTGLHPAVPQEISDAIQVKIYLPIILFSLVNSKTYFPKLPPIVDGQGVDQAVGDEPLPTSPTPNFP